MPSKYKAYNNLGKIYAEEGRFYEAIEMYEESIALNPDHKSAYNNMAITYMHNSAYQKALHNFIAALKIDPYYEESLHNLNILYQRVSELLPYQEDDTPGELSILLNELLQDPIWQAWEYRHVERERSQISGSPAIEALRLQNIQPQLSGAIEVTLAVNPGIPLNISPNLIFYTINGEITFIMNQFKSFDAEKSEISLLILPRENNNKNDDIKLYVILSDFRYYSFPINANP